jgi:hypothetical protein
MGEAHKIGKKTAQPKSETSALATGKISAINRKRSPVQSHTQTYNEHMEFS